MVRYQRNFIAGGTFFFRAMLVDRSSCVFVEQALV